MTTRRGTPWDREMAKGLAEDFVQILEGHMARKGVTRADLARRLGVSRVRVTQMLNDGPNLTLRAMAAALGAVDRRLVLRSGLL